MKAEKIEDAARVLLDAAPKGSKVIAFGSQVLGTARADSDLDLLVIEPSVDNRFAETHRLRMVLEQVFEGVVQPIDLIVTETARFEKWSKQPNTLAFEALRDGWVYE